MHADKHFHFVLAHGRRKYLCICLWDKHVCFPLLCRWVQALIQMNTSTTSWQALGGQSFQWVISKIQTLRLSSCTIIGYQCTQMPSVFTNPQLVPVPLQPFEAAVLKCINFVQCRWSSLMRSTKNQANRQVTQSDVKADRLQKTDRKLWWEELRTSCCGVNYSNCKDNTQNVFNIPRGRHNFAAQCKYYMHPVVH